MTTKKKLILTSFFFFLISLVFLTFSFFLIKKIEKISAEIFEKRKEELSLSLRLKNISDFKRVKKEERISKLDEIFFDKEIPLPFVFFLEESAKKAGIEIEILAQEVSEKEESIFIPVYFNLRFSGEPRSAFLFLEKIENSKFLLEFEKLSISRTKEGKIEGEVLIKVFTKK